jgi:CRP-like cAMP-binding protein
MKACQIDAAWQGTAECRDCGVRDLVLFAELNEQDFSLIHQPIDEIRFEAGAVIYESGQEGRALYTIRSGLVKLVQYLPDGTQRIVRLLRQGATAGLEALVSPTYEHSAVVLQSALVCRLPREVVERLSRETPRLHSQLMRRWHSALHQADGWLTELSTGNARQRVARLFLHLLASAGGPTVQLLSREDVGAMLGITTETASRTVAEFKRQTLVTEVGTNRFTCDRDGLERVAQGGS